jgi:hypothetical protein
MELKDAAKIVKDPEAREAIIAAISETREDIYPIYELLKETVGSDIDKVIKELIDWIANNTAYAVQAYIDQGFTREEAIQLVAGARVALSQAARR